MSSTYLSPRPPTGLHRDAPKRARAVVTGPGPLVLNTIYTGDCRELGAMVPDNSVDCIFTDPPYEKASLHLYSWLSEFGARVLKPSGVLLAYAGSYWKPQVMQSLGQSLDYFMEFIILHNYASRDWQKHVLMKHKSIMCYTKGRYVPEQTFVLSAWGGGGRDKRYHVWGQDESTARYYVECFTVPGALVIDPFMGGGTTAYVCRQLQRPFIGFEIDDAYATRARSRLDNIQMMMPLEQPLQSAMELPSA